MPIFDSHLHIIDPRFPLVPNQQYIPEPFTCADYLARAKALGVAGGAVVSGSFQGYDQAYLLTALQTLGPAFVGVTQVPATIGDTEIQALDQAGVRAVRFNFKRGVAADPAALVRFAQRIHECAGWHVELYVDGSNLADLYPVLTALPKLVIDHLGLSRSGLPTLLRLVERGVYVKATGFGRLDFNPGPVLRDIAAANPDALLFGTDLPSTRAPRPFQDQDLDLIKQTLTREQAAKACFENAVALYRPVGLAAGADASV